MAALVSATAQTRMEWTGGLARTMLEGSREWRRAAMREIVEKLKGGFEAAGDWREGVEVEVRDMRTEMVEVAAGGVGEGELRCG